MNRLLSLVAATALLAACAPATPPAEPAPEAFQPTGLYQFTTDVMGDPVTGTIRIEGDPGAYRAVLTSSMAPGEARARSVTVEGQTVLIQADMDSPMGRVPVYIRMEIDGDRFTGSWSAEGEWGAVRGERRPLT